MKTTRAAFKNSLLPKSVKGGEEIDVLVSPLGTFPHPDGEQLCTREAFDALVAKWEADGKPEILVDFDHASETGGPTEAAAWATELSSEDDGLHAVFRMTDKGAEALTATRYRYLSPAWYVDEEGHPTELSTIALTNRPNLPVPRLLNRRPDGPSFPPSVATQNAEAGESHLPDPAGAGKGDPPDEGKTTNQKTPDMEKLKEMLGLAAEATEDEILAAVDALRSERDELRSEKEKMEAAAKEAALDAEADKFVEEQGDKIADRDACKNAYKRDPEGTRALFNALAKPAKPAPAPARVVNVNAAKRPEAELALANCKSGKERMAWALAHAADKVD